MSDLQEKTPGGGWLEALDAGARAKAEAQLELLRRCGARDPESWVRAEIEKGSPHTTRFMVLRHFWPESIDCWRHDSNWVRDCIDEAEENPAGCFADAGVALKRLVEAGARAEDLAAVARMISYETVFHVLQVIDEGCDVEHEESGPRWALMEVGPEGTLTGRHIDGLHESILRLDPSGCGGRPPAWETAP